jgi:hypothetical protein
MLGGAGHAGDGAALMLPFATIGCPTIGGLIGAVQSPSETEVQEAHAALESGCGPEHLGEALRGDLGALLARDAPQYQVTLLAPSEAEQPPAALAPDTVIALENLRVALVP